VRVLWYSHPQCLPLSPADDSCYLLKSPATSDPLPRTASTTTMKVQSSRSAYLVYVMFQSGSGLYPTGPECHPKGPSPGLCDSNLLWSVTAVHPHQTSQNLLGLVFTHKFRLYFNQVKM